MRSLCLALLYSMAAPVASAQALFPSSNTYPIGKSPLPIAAGDFNGDGRLDIVVAEGDHLDFGAPLNPVFDSISVLLGNGDGTFQSALSVPSRQSCEFPRSMVVGDFNEDGKLDVALGCSNTGIVALGKGDGTFQKPIVVSGAEAVAVGDFNQDGHLDLAFTGVSNSGQLTILLGNGDGTFRSAATYPVGTAIASPNAIAVHDFNGDGALDILVANSQSRDPSKSDLALLLGNKSASGNPDGTFQPAVHTAITSQAMSPLSLALGDFNGDGLADLAIGNFGGNSVDILLGRRDGSFQLSSSSFVHSPVGIALADFNGDGRLDVAVTDELDNRLIVYFGNGDGTLRFGANVPVGTFAAGVVAAPLVAGTRNAALALTNFGDDTITVLLQTLPPTPTATTLTSSSPVSVTGQAVTFTASVKASSGNGSPSGQVTFRDGNLVLATIPFDSAVGPARFRTSALTAGVHSITAEYKDTANTLFQGSRSAPLVQTVNAGPVGCSCSLTGAYQTAAAPVALLHGASSPNGGKYSLDFSGGVLKITTAGRTVLDFSGINPISDFGFSPDGDRFVIKSIRSFSEDVFVWDLTRPNLSISSGPHLTVGGNAGGLAAFSPSGRFFFYALLNGASEMNLQIYQVQGVALPLRVYESGSIHFAVGSGSDFQSAAWGFGPDTPESTFIYSYGIDATHNQLDMVRLVPNAFTASGPVFRNGPLQTFLLSGVSASGPNPYAWSFSPCGDVLAIETSLPAQTQVDLFRTVNGTHAGDTSVPADLSTVTVTCTAGQQQVLYGNQTVNITSNTACSNTPASNQPVVVVPKDPVSGDTPVAVTFSNLSAAGQTTLKMLSSAPTIPPNFKLGIAFDLVTTAHFGSAQVCFDYARYPLGSGRPPRLLHNENGTWKDVTQFVDSVNQIVCGTVTGLSPFAIVEDADTTPPTTTASVSSPPNAAGWYRQDVTITLSSVDEPGGSGVHAITYSESLDGGPTLVTTVEAASVQFTVSAEGITTITFYASDNAGNVETSNPPLTIKLDKTPPTIAASRAPPPNQYGWNNSDVTVSFACADSLSGVASCGPSPQVVSSEGDNQSRVGTAVDVAGNVATLTVAGVSIDKTPPVMSCSAQPDVLWPPNDKLVDVLTSVVVTDALSGSAGFQLEALTSNEPAGESPFMLGWQIGAASTSGQLRAERLGQGTGRVYTFTYLGFDRAGNEAVCAPVVTVPHDKGKH